MLVRLSYTRALAALAAALVIVVAAWSAQPASSASSGSVNLQMTIASATTLGTCSPGAATRFGTVLPGTSNVTSSDCTVTFGSTNDTSMLRAYQSDEAGSAMFAMTDGKLDADWDGPSGTGNGQFVVPGIWPDTSWDVSMPPVAMQPTTGKMLSAVRDGNELCLMRFNEDGTLDSSFGGSGTGINCETSFPHRHVRSIVPAPDGSVYVFDENDWTYEMYVLKFTPSGVLDAAFDGPSGIGNGIVEIPNPVDYVYVGKILLQPDGKIVVVGTRLNGGYVGAVTRIMPDGTLDTSFGGGDGYANYDVGGHTWFDDAVLQPDGKLVVVGHEWIGNQDFVAGRIMPDGSLDATFDGPTTPENGLFSIPGPGTAEDQAYGVGLASDGDVVIAGATDAGDADVLTVRLQGTDGAYDAAWDGPSGTGNGMARYTLTAGDDGATGVLVAPTGEIYVSGYMGAADSDPMLMRLDEFGKLDTQFDGDSGAANGVVRVTSTSSDDSILGMALARDGDIVASVISEAGSPDQLRMLRFNGSTVNDYDDSGLGTDHDWTAANGFFGMCLSAFTGTSAAATWTAQAGCPQDDTSTYWRAVPPRTGAIKVGQIGSGAVDGSASFRFALNSPLAQRAGRYAAPITFEVVAPAA